MAGIFSKTNASTWLPNALSHSSRLPPSVPSLEIAAPNATEVAPEDALAFLLPSPPRCSLARHLGSARVPRRWPHTFAGNRPQWDDEAGPIWTFYDHSSGNCVEQEEAEIYLASTARRITWRGPQPAMR
jgi:hypothetical protein